MYEHQRDDYKVYCYIKNNFPKHLRGYENGWLKIEQIETYDATHIYTKVNGNWIIIGTVL